MAKAIMLPMTEMTTSVVDFSVIFWQFGMGASIQTSLSPSLWKPSLHSTHDFLPVASFTLSNLQSKQCLTLQSGSSFVKSCIRPRDVPRYRVATNRKSTFVIVSFLMSDKFNNELQRGLGFGVWGLGFGVWGL